MSPSFFAAMVISSLLGASLPAQAQGWFNSCQAATTKSQTDCDRAISAAAAKGAEMQASVADMASKNKLDGAPQQSATGSQAIQAQTQNAEQAKQVCQRALDECASKCKAQLSAAQPHVNPPDPLSTQARSDVSRIPNHEKQECEQKIQAKMATIKANSDPLPDQKKDAQNTGQQSGQAPQMSPPSGGDSPSDTATPAATNTAADTPSSPTAAADGSSGLLPSSVPGSDKNPAANAADPTAAVRDSTSSGAAASGGAASSGGGGGSMSASSGMTTASLAPAAAKAGDPHVSATGNGGNLSADSGGGGGGGGYSNSNLNSDTSFDPAHLPKWGDKEKPLLPAAPVAGSGVTDQSQPHGPSLFFIADQAHASFCRKRGITKACAK